MQDAALEIPDRNTHLPDDVIERGLNEVLSALSRCGMHFSALAAEQFNSKSLLHGHLGEEFVVVYVQITVDNEDEIDVGLLPKVLIDAADELCADPYVVGVQMRRGEKDMAFRYSGLEELLQRARAIVAEWRTQSIGPKTFDDYRRLVKGHVSKLNLVQVHEIWDDRETMELRLYVDGRVPYWPCIGACALLESTFRNGSHFVFTCSCGDAGCNGIHRGIVVVHEGSHILWKAYYAQGRRIFIFNRDEYRNEILLKCSRLIDFVNARDHHSLGCVERHFAYLEKCYAEAVKAAASEAAHELRSEFR